MTERMELCTRQIKENVWAKKHEEERKREREGESNKTKLMTSIGFADVFGATTWKQTLKYNSLQYI